MSIFKKRTWRQRVAKTFNLLVVLSMLVTTLPAAPAMAAPHYQTPETDGNCLRSTTSPNPGTDIFLPFISSLQGSLSNVFASASVPIDAPRTIMWEAGNTYLYDYEVQIDNAGFKRDAEGPSQKTASSRTVVEAEAEIAITEVKEDGTAVGQILLKDPFVCSTDTSTTDASSEEVVDNAEFAAELQKPLIFEQAPNGTITSVQVPEDSRAAATNVQKGVINALQMTLDANIDSYMAVEIGGQGTYTASYTLMDDGDNLNITKSYGTGSFTEMNRAGDDDNGAMTMNTSFEALLDGTQGILTSVTGAESIKTGDGIEEADGSNAGFDGATAWTEIDSNTKLTFKSVNRSRNVQAASLTAVYVVDGLGATFPDEGTNQNLEALDIDSADIAGTIQSLVDAPATTEPFMAVMELVSVDEGTTVLDAVKAAIDANAANSAAVSALIDVLTAAGTPYAQDILAGIVAPSLNVGAASLSATLDVTDTEKALINLVLLDSPTMSTVNAIKNVSEGGGDLQGTAVSVLGATIDKLSESNEDMADELTSNLIAGLSNADTEEDVELYLGALGNAAQEETAAEVSKYLTETLALGSGETLTETIGIQFAAYSALGRIPGDAAEAPLVAALNDSDELLGTRLVIFDLLSQREDLSPAGLAALSANTALKDFGTEGTDPEPGSVTAAEANAPDLVISRTWNKTFGNSKLGLALPGVFTAKTPPHYNGLYLYTQQKADAKVWNRTINLADGRLKLWRNSSTTYKFGAYLDLLNYRIRRKYERQFTCGWSQSGSLWTGSYSQSFNYSIPVLAIITVGVQIRLGAHASLNYSVSANVCNPANLTASGSITPRAYATASADAYVSIVVARGGVGVSARIMDTSFILSLNAALVNFNQPRVCVNIRITTQALSGRVYAFADVRTITWSGFKWKRVFDGNLTTFSTPTRTYSIWNNCWP